MSKKLKKGLGYEWPKDQKAESLKPKPNQKAERPNSRKYKSELELSQGLEALEGESGRD